MRRIFEADDNLHDNMIDVMSDFMDDEPQVGIFWYNIPKNELFGVLKDDAYKYQHKRGVGTLGKLHRSHWKKQHIRAVQRGNINSPFYKESNYTMIPRGRVFIKSNGELFVAVGNWIYENNVNIEDLRDLIIDEFNLSDDFKFSIDSHWNIGNGWEGDNC